MGNLKTLPHDGAQVTPPKEQAGLLQKNWDGIKEFLKRHQDTLWACDFFTKNVVTKGGIVTFYVLYFIHMRSRRVHVAGMSPAPDSAWMPSVRPGPPSVA